MTMGQKIKELRKAKKLSQKELAGKIGTTQSAINNWEQDKFYPSLFSCLVMADFFKVTLDELCCRNFKVGDDNG